MSLLPESYLTVYIYTDNVQNQALCLALGHLCKGLYVCIAFGSFVQNQCQCSASTVRLVPDDMFKRKLAEDWNCFTGMHLGLFS